MKCLKSNVIGKYCRRFEVVVICFFPQDGVGVLLFFCRLRGMRLLYCMVCGIMLTVVSLIMLLFMELVVPVCAGTLSGRKRSHSIFNK